MVVDEKRNGCYCLNHPECGATIFFVRFEKVFKNFHNYFAAYQFLQGLRFKFTEGTFDERDYQKEAPLGFKNLANAWLDCKARPVKRKGRKARHPISDSTLRNYKNYMRRAINKWGNKNIKDIQEKDIDDFLFGIKNISEKTRHNHRICLYNFWKWVVRREKICMPDIPEIEFELEYRRITNFETQRKIIDEVFNISNHINPKIHLGCDMLASYTNLRPQDLLKITEANIDLVSGVITIHFPTKRKNTVKSIKLLDRHIKSIEIMKKYYAGMPHMPFFRHVKGVSGVKAEEQFGEKYFYKWWKRACRNLGVEGLDLYGGTRHTTTTESAKLLGPAAAKQALGNTSNKSMERYCLIQDDGTHDIVKQIDELKKGNGKIVKFRQK